VNAGNEYEYESEMHVNYLLFSVQTGSAVIQTGTTIAISWTHPQRAVQG